MCAVYQGKKKYDIIPLNGIIILVLLLTIVALIQSASPLWIKNAFAQVPTVRITRSVPQISDGGQVPLPAGQHRATVTFEYTGTESNDRLQQFLCTWDGRVYGSENCPTILSGQNTYSMTGRVTEGLCPGNYQFGVKVVNNRITANPEDPNRVSLPDTRRFTVTPPVTFGHICLNPASFPNAGIYKAYSSSPDYNEHDYYNGPYGPTTPYSNMYIVLEGLYEFVLPPGGLSGSDRMEDIFENVGTTFQCKWDDFRGTATYTDCGRYNVITGVSPGIHKVDFKARNSNGAAGDGSSLIWCVGDRTVECTSSYMPSNYQTIGTGASHIRSFNSEEDVKFPTGNNQTISIKDLKGFAIENQTVKALNGNKSQLFTNNGTLGKNLALQNKTISNRTGSTNITGFWVKPDNKSLSVVNTTKIDLHNQSFSSTAP